MSSDLPPAVFPQPVDLNAEDVETRDLRTAAGRAYRLAATKSAAYTLQVAVDLTFEKDLLAGYRRQLWIVLGLGLIASILIGRRIAIRGLRPLKEISQTVRRIRSTNLHEHVPLDRMPSEVQELASTFNNMLDRLGDSFERLSQFSSDIAHELRTPLNNLRGEIDLALSKKRSPEEYVDLLGSLSEECDQLSRLIDSLLSLARAEQPAMQINREQVDIVRELRLVCEFYERAAAEAGVRLSVSAPEQRRSHLDRTLFKRAIGNLVQNALAHTPSNGEVQIAASNGAGELIVSVSDTGTAISESDLPRVFDRFYRADPARTRNRGAAVSGSQLYRTLLGCMVEKPKSRVRWVRERGLLCCFHCWERMGITNRTCAKRPAHREVMGEAYILGLAHAGGRNAKAEEARVVRLQACARYIEVKSVLPDQVTQLRVCAARRRTADGEDGIDAVVAETPTEDSLADHPGRPEQDHLHHACMDFRRFPLIPAFECKEFAFCFYFSDHVKLHSEHLHSE